MPIQFIQCRQCGARLPEDAVFCQACGTDQPTRKVKQGQPGPAQGQSGRGVFVQPQKVETSHFGAAIFVVAIVLVGGAWANGLLSCSEPKPAAMAQPETLKATDYADKIGVSHVDWTWAPPKTNPKGQNLLWYCAWVKNNSTATIARIDATVEFYDKRTGVKVATIQDIIYYGDGSSGRQPLKPQQSYRGDAYRDGDPVPDLELNFVEGDVDVVVYIDHAWEDLTTKPNGIRGEEL